jgi:hypothetical protein
MFLRVLFTAVLAAGLALAQRGGGGGGGGMGDDMGGGMGGGGGRGMDGMGGGMGMRPQRQSKFEQFVEKLKLSKEQGEEVQKAFSAAQEEAAPIRSQMDQGRVTIAGALIEGKSADDVKKMQDAYAALCAKMAAVEAKAFAKVYATLKPNQQSKAPAAFELMAGMFERPAGGGARRGGRQ